MTNKYSELSDEKINELVGMINEKSFNKVMMHAGWSNYTGNEALALKLMVDNKITLSPTPLANTWHASSPIIYPRTVVGSTKRNPCRAIAECFLLMKDAENNNG